MVQSNTSKLRISSGMRPTGKLHLGHVVGALKKWVALQDQYQSFHFIADWHALTCSLNMPAIPGHHRRSPPTFGGFLSGVSDGNPGC